MKLNKTYRIEEACWAEKGREPLQAPHLDVENKRLVATDGRIMAILPVHPEEGDMSGPVPIEAIQASRKARERIHCNGLVAVEGGPTYARPDLGTFPALWKDITDKGVTEWFAQETKAAGSVHLALDVDLLMSLAKALGKDAKASIVHLRFNADAGLCTGPILVTLAKTVPPEHVDGENEGEIRQKPLGILMPCRVD